MEYATHSNVAMAIETPRTTPDLPQKPKPQ